MNKNYARSIAILLALGFEACAAEPQAQQDELLDDSPISLADQGPSASDSGRDLFSESNRLVGNSFGNISGVSVDFQTAGELRYRVSFAFAGGHVDPAQQNLTTRGRAFVKVETILFSNPSDLRTALAFDSYDTAYRFDGSTFTADVNGHRITIKSPTEIHIDWAAGTPSALVAFASDLEGTAAMPTFGDRGNVDLSGRLWNSLEVEARRSGRSEWFGDGGNNSYEKSVVAGPVEIACQAKRVLGFTSQKACRLWVTGPQVERADYSRVVQAELEGANAQKLWDALGGDDEYRGFSSDNAAVGCRSERGVIRCIAQAAAR